MCAVFYFNQFSFIVIERVYVMSFWTLWIFFRFFAYFFCTHSPALRAGFHHLAGSWINVHLKG